MMFRTIVCTAVAGVLLVACDSEIDTNAEKSNGSKSGPSSEVGVGSSNDASAKGVKVKRVEVTAESDSPGQRFARLVAEFGAVDRPEEKATVLRELEDLAAIGYNPAAVFAGNLHRQGVSGRPNFRRAFELYLDPSLEGYSEAYLGLVLSALRLPDKGGYTEGQLYDILKSSVDFHPTAAGYVNLGLMYAEGKGTTRNVKEALNSYRQARTLGAPGMKVLIGDLYVDARHPEFNPDKALELYQSAREGGSVSASFRIANYFSGRIDGVSKNSKLAVEALKDLVDDGNTRAKYITALLYSDRDSNVYSEDKSLAMLESLDSDSAYLLKADLLSREGPNKDIDAAESIYTRLSDLGNKTARYRWAILVIQSRNDFDAARKILADEIESSDARALQIVGANGD